MQTRVVTRMERAAIAHETYLEQAGRCPGCRRRCDCDRCAARGADHCPRGRQLLEVAAGVISEAMGATDMAKRGPKPRPPEVKALEGERPDRVNPAAPAPPDGVGPPPEVLDAEGRKQWARLAPLLTRAGVLKETDADALALYCAHYSRWVQAARVVRAEGLLISGGQGALKMNPAISIERECMAAMSRLLAEFGATPSSRSRVRVEAEGPRDDLAEYLGG